MIGKDYGQEKDLCSPGEILKTEFLGLMGMNAYALAPSP